MRKQTVLLVMALCIMGIVTCVMWGERDAERALRSSAESRLAQTREQLMQAQALQEDAEDALSAGKETWREQLATVTAERDELSVSNAALQAQAEEAANALAQAQTQQESLEAQLDGGPGGSNGSGIRAGRKNRSPGSHGPGARHSTGKRKHCGDPGNKA